MTRTRRTLGLAAATLAAVGLATTAAAAPASAVEPTGGVVGGADPVTENVTLYLSSFKLAYQPQDRKGAKKGGAVEAGYDVAGAATMGKAGGETLPYLFVD